MKKLITLLLLLSAGGIAAQEYDQAAGVRLGITPGLSYKKFVAPEEAVDILLSGRRNGIQVTTLYEWHRALEVSFENYLFLYYGVGGHLGYERFGDLRKVLISDNPVDFVYEDKSYLVIGADLIIGAEYRILSVPMTVGFEVKPYFSYVGMRFTNARFWDAALSVKYVF